MNTPESNRKQQEETDRLMAVIREEAQSRSKKARKMRTLGVSLLVVMIASVLIISLVTHHFQFTFLFSFGSFFAIIGVAAAVSKRQKEPPTALVRLEALPLEAVGPLTDALGFGNKEIAAFATARLITLLPRLRSDDAHLLNQEQRQILNRQCISGKNTALTLAILKAYVQMGDSGAIPTVLKLANRRPHAAHDRLIRRAAMECLPFLDVRAEDTRMKTNLLRSAHAPAGPPASGAPEAIPSNSHTPKVRFPWKRR